MSARNLNAIIFSSFGKYLKREQNWETMMKTRLQWNEENPWSELSDWEEKIAMKKKFREKQVPFIKSYYEAYQPFSASDLAIAVKNAAKHSKLVVKPSHMTSGNYVFIISGDRVSIPAPAGPGSHVMQDRAEKWRKRKRRIMLHDVVRGIGDAMEKNAGDREGRALRDANRGVIVEEFHPHDAEVRVLAIGGRAVVGATDSQWILIRDSSSDQSDSGDWKQIGNIDHPDDWILQEGQWERMVGWSESLAAETDLLRVDFLVSRGNNNNNHNNNNNNNKTSDEDAGGCVASEMCAFLWPESSFFGKAYPTLERQLLDYHDVEENQE